MSGTSLDGVDAALLRTDGEAIQERGPWLSVPYDSAFREQLALAAQHRKGDIPLLARELTLRHAEAVHALLRQAGIKAAEVALIGFHGQTIDHRPKAGISWQIGDGALLASRTGIDVVTDFRRRDLAEGGQGAPLVPLYHAALAAGLPKPVAILNIGGVANVTWIGADDLCAFDTGPGNGLIDSLMLARTGHAYDEGGAQASQGRVDEAALDACLRHPFFALPPPKSLDRHDFTLESVAHLSTPDAAATLVQFTVEAVARAQAHFPKSAKQWLVCGGGRHNAVLMDVLKKRLGAVQPVEALGWEGDALEAQAFAYLAVRAKAGLPTSLPQITGARRPVTGGAFYPA